jgi:predicted nucleic acid-binding protein
MSFLLDTNICSAYIKLPGKLAHRFIQHGGGLFVPTIVMAELFTWAEQRAPSTKLMDQSKRSYCRSSISSTSIWIVLENSAG